MAPLFLPQIRDGFGSIGDGIKGAAGKVADTGGDVVGKTADVGNTAVEGAAAAVDTSKDLVETAGKVKDLMGTFEDLKAQMMEYYPTFLKWQARWEKYKWAFKSILVIIGSIIVMCLLQCAIGYLKCFCYTFKGIQACATGCINCGSKLGKCCGCLFIKCGDSILGSHIRVVGEKRAIMAAEQTGPGLCDMEYITSCGNPPGKKEKERIRISEGREPDAEDQRWLGWLYERIPCVPRSWSVPLTTEGQLERIQAKLAKLAVSRKNLKPGPTQKITRLLWQKQYDALDRLAQRQPEGDLKDRLLTLAVDLAEGSRKRFNKRNKLGVEA